MFTIQQIKQAYSRVKSGSDFPMFASDLDSLGVIEFVTFVKNGHSVYAGENNFRIESGPVYENLTINEKSDPDAFGRDLKLHQADKTDFVQFCQDAANSGIEKWVVDLSAMNCTYFDKKGNRVWIETIPLGNAETMNH